MKLKDHFEMVGLVAVVVSLGLLVFEIQQTRLALEAQTYENRAFQAINYFAELMQHEDLPELLVTDKPIDELTRRERFKKSILIRNNKIDYDNDHYQYQRGFLDEEFYKRNTVPGIRRSAPIWRQFGYTEERQAFKDEVDRILNETKED